MTTDRIQTKHMPAGSIVGTLHVFRAENGDWKIHTSTQLTLARMTDSDPVAVSAGPAEWREDLREWSRPTYADISRALKLIETNGPVRSSGAWPALKPRKARGR